MTWSDAWSTQQLVEYVAAISTYPDHDVLVQQAVERAVEALDADIGALLCGDRVTASIGFRGDAPQADLLRAIGSGHLLVPGLGDCAVLAALVDGPPDSRLLLARADGTFGLEEASLLRGMGRVLALAARQLELVAELRSRQRLLEQLGVVQRALARRSPLQDVLDAITSGARELLGSDVVALRLLDPEAPGQTVLASAQGLSELQFHHNRRLPMHEGLAGQAMREQALVSVGCYEQLERPSADLVGELTAGMAAPVREDNRTVGALAVASKDPLRRYGERDRDVLAAFADHVSLALTDAHTLQAVQLARHDPLTGLPNRGLFLDRLARELDGPAARPTSVLFVDLDKFKGINDTLGHAAGDELLVTVAARLRSAVRGNDLTGRLGGDEFAILLPGADGVRATRVAARVLEVLGAPLTLAGRAVVVQASIGVATTPAGDNPDVPGAVPDLDGGAALAADLLRSADLAMYRAKSRDGHCYEVFSPALSQAVLRRAELHEDLARAQQDGQLWLALQPVVDLRTDQLVGAEALLRWSHPTRGLIPPLEFIPLAEETGQIIGIGRWVLRQACGLAVSWPVPEDGLPLTIAVNLSACQLADPALVDDVAAALTDSGLDAAQLILEITESVLIRDVDCAVGQLHRLKALGVRLAIDDFGTGYSSLAYLARFPVDILKIDRSFVIGMTDSPQAAALTEAIQRLAESMHLQVIAEGIENEEHLLRIRALDCHYGQGYALGLPVRSHLFPGRVPALPAPTAGPVSSRLGPVRQSP